MRILIASDTYHPHVNGASYFTQRLSHALADAGHEVAVISPSTDLSNTKKRWGKVQRYGLRSFPIIVPGFRFVLPWVINPAIRRALVEFKPDIVHIQSHFFISRATLNAAQKRGIPVVATNHFMPDNLTHYLHLPKIVTEAIHSVMWRDAARVYRKAKGLSSPTRTAADLVQPQLNQEILAISNGIDLARFNPSNDPTPAQKQYNLPKKPTLLFVGRLDKEKNVDVVLRAVAVARKSVNFHFVVAGHGAEEVKLKTLAQTLELEADTTFCGFVPDELLPSLYAAADCFVIAGIAELQCIVAMEAMATGLPVVGARAVALPELIHHKENGLLFEPGDSTELAGQLVEIFTKSDMRHTMGKKSLEIIAKHDINLTLEQFEQFYRQALNGRATV
ncbi:MAG: glycosyltransferase [bacterium]|nr:glycosyltransferase [bacterium]